MKFIEFESVMQKKKAYNPSQVYKSTRSYLADFHGSNAGNLRSLFLDHYLFLHSGLVRIRAELAKVNIIHHDPSDLTALLATYDLLLKCLHLLVTELGENISLLYEHWVSYIQFLISFGDYKSAKDVIPLFLGIVNNNNATCIVPDCGTYTHHDKCEPLVLLDILEGYLKCLSQRDLGLDYSRLVDVIEGIDDWFKVFDGDLARRKRLVQHLMKNIEFDNEEASAKLFGLVLVEQAKMDKDASLVQLGVELVIKKKTPFLIDVLKHLAHKFKLVQPEDLPGTDESTSCINQLQWYRKNGCLQGTICLTIESIISYRLLEDMFRDKSPQFLLAINLIAKARTSLEKGTNDCLENLDMAIKTLDKFDANKNDRGASLFLRGQALCLRALCRYEEPDSAPQAFIKDINDALEMWSKSDLIDTNSLILEYTTKLLLFVFDALMKNHNEDSHELLEDILKFIKRSDSKARMLWQFISHDSHIKSQMIQNHFQNETIDQCFIKKYGAVIEEGETNKKLERMFSYIMNKEVPLSLESACLVAHICYDLAERMFLLGDMSTALKYATEGRKVRYRLIEESSVLPSNTQSGENVYALLMNPSVAAHVWSLTSEEFILPPNGNFICCLMSMHQEATILELMGNQIEALEVLKHGKSLSLGRGSSFFAGRFQAAIGKIHRKSQALKLAEVELKEAKEQCRLISCKKCKLLLNVEIVKESVKLIRKKGSVSHNTQARKDHLVSAERMLREELMHSKGFKDWERSCRFSMLSVLIEIGKDHVYNNRTAEAGDVFLKCINLVYLSSLPQSHSQTKLSSFVDFFNLIEKSQAEFSFGTQVANIIYLISWMAYKMSKETRKTRDDLFSIPIEKLTSALKLALVLSSEVTELFEKVAQLLAIIYYLSQKQIGPAKVTNLQWACFFQQLTVGSDVNYLFSHKLREVYGVSDPDNTLHRLTPNVNADLTEFVTKFYEDLPPHTILVLNIIGNKYADLLKTLLPSAVPCDCVALMMLARFNSKSQPVVGLFPVDSVPECDKPYWRGPWGTGRVVDAIALDFKRIIKDYHMKKSEALKTVDDRTRKFLRRMETWFGHHQYILLGEPVGSPMNPKQDYHSGFVGIAVKDKSPASTSSSYGGIHGSSEREPVILVLGKNIHMFPWERMEVSKDQEFYRMPSVSSIFYSYYLCDKIGRITKKGSAVYGIVDPFDAFYVISPDKSKEENQSLKESRLAKFFGEELKLDGRLWTNVQDIIEERLKTHSFFMYSGHGDGMKHLPGGRTALRKLDWCASSSLMGCGSGMLKVRGPYTPIGAPIDYLLAGSPVVISNLYNIYATWAGCFYHRLLRECKRKMSMTDEVGFGSCHVTAKNSTGKLLLSCGTIIYGVPTVIQKGTK